MTRRRLRDALTAALAFTGAAQAPETAPGAPDPPLSASEAQQTVSERLSELYDVYLRLGDEDEYAPELTGVSKAEAVARFERLKEGGQLRKLGGSVELRRSSGELRRRSSRPVPRKTGEKS